MNRHKMAADPRWRQIDSLENAQALLVGIEECSEAIAAHAMHFDPLNPVLSNYEIKREIRTQLVLIDRLRLFQAGQRNQKEQEIKADA